MAVTNINFSLDGTDYLSDEIVAEAADLAIAIAVEAIGKGSISIERSIDGVTWVTEETVNDLFNLKPYGEFNVYGAVAGQKLKVRFEKCVPTAIKVLQ